MSTDKRLAIKPALNQFNGGEISPQLEGRYDWDKYNYSSKLCKNFIPTIEGSLKRRGGSHYVSLKRGSGTFSFKINVVLADFSVDDPTPTVTLSINGASVPLHTVSQFFVDGRYVTDTLTYVDGTRLSYTVSSTGGYISKSGTIVVDINQKDVTLTISKSSSGNGTITFIAPATATITLNGTTATSITDSIGTTVTYVISFLGTTTTGTLTIDGDKKYFVYRAESVLVVTDSEILMVDYNANGTIYLPTCKIRYIGVGSGGGSNIKSPLYAGGGSGAGCDVMLNISEGQYDWVVGTKGDNKNYPSNKKGQDGTATSLKKGNTTFVSNGGGKGGYIQVEIKPHNPTHPHTHTTTYEFLGGQGGSNTINNSYLNFTNWTKAGNSGGSQKAGAAVYGNYGKGGSSTAAKDGYLYLSFVED